MTRSASITAVAAIAIIMTASAVAEVDTDISLGSGYQANLFSDSHTIGDSYGTAGLSMSVYPSGSTQLAASMSYNAFATYTDLSNFTGNIVATVIPTSESSRVSFAMTGGISARSFGSGFAAYNRRAAGAGMNLGVHLSDRIRLATSASVQDEDFTASDYGSNSSFDLSSGINLSLPGANAFSVRFDYSRCSYDQPSLDPPTMGTSRTGSATMSQAFDIMGGTVRYSRPLGFRSGINLSGGYRLLGIKNDFIAFGYTIDYLSPWAELWEGASFSGGVKHFFPNQVIADVSFAYYDKSFVAVMEGESGDGELLLTGKRSDQLSAFSLSLSRPVTLNDGRSVVPAVYMSYRRNLSSIELYEYDDIVATISIKLSL